jgi:putative redox protein
MSREVRVHTDLAPPPARFRQLVEVAAHRLVADEPVDSGGGDAGPAPHELLLAALGACTSMTLKLYAERKGWPLRECDVKLTYSKERRESGEVTLIQRAIVLHGDGLTAEQRERLLEIAGKCPVHKTLTNPIEISTNLE